MARVVSPHPNPLPQGEGVTLRGIDEVQATRIAREIGDDSPSPKGEGGVSGKRTSTAENQSNTMAVGTGSGAGVVEPDAGSNSVAQFGFALLCSRQRVLFLEDGFLAGVFHPPGLNRVEFDARLELSRQVRFGVNRFHGTFRHARRAINAILRVND